MNAKLPENYKPNLCGLMVGITYLQVNKIGPIMIKVIHSKLPILCTCHN